MKLRDIRNMPTSLDYATLNEWNQQGSIGLHESLLRSFHIVEKVAELLHKRTPPKVILELIEDLRANDKEVPHA